MENNPAVISRQDLLATVKASYKGITAGSIADYFAPVFPVRNKVGNIPVNTFYSGSNVSVGRSAGATVTGSVQNVSLPAYSCTEVLSRNSLDKSLDAMLGNAGSELQVALNGVLNVSLAIEQQAADLATTGSVVNATGSILTTIREQVLGLKAQGEVQLLGGANVIQAIKVDREVADAQKATTGFAIAPTDARYLSDLILAATFGCDYVRPAWGPYAAVWPSDIVVLEVCPDKLMAPWLVAQATRRIAYEFAADAGWETMAIEQLWDPSTRSDVIDCLVYSQIMTPFNGGFIVPIKVF